MQVPISILPLVLGFWRARGGVWALRYSKGTDLCPSTGRRARRRSTLEVFSIIRNRGTLHIDDRITLVTRLFFDHAESGEVMAGQG